jgi:hypothetical protein
MAVSSNQKVGELARIAYLALLHAEGELGEETNTFALQPIGIAERKAGLKRLNLSTRRQRPIGQPARS